MPTKWGWIVAYPDKLKLGKNIDIGAFSYLQAEYGIEIEDDVQIAGGVKIYSSDTIDNAVGKVILKKGCCIGANSVIFPGVTIGKNSIVGALSLVDKDIPENVVAYGCPCKVVRKL